MLQAGWRATTRSISSSRRRAAGRGLVDGFLLADALTGGNRLYEDALAVSKQIDDLDQFKINAGDLVVHER